MRYAKKSTKFHSRQTRALTANNRPSVSASNQGGRIRTGPQIGRATSPDTIELLYHCITHDGEVLAGWSRGRLGVDDAGRTTLHFVWGWLSGAQGGGESSYVEVETTIALAD